MNDFQSTPNLDVDASVSPDVDPRLEIGAGDLLDTTLPAHELAPSDNVSTAAQPPSPVWSQDQQLDPAWLTTTRMGAFIAVGILTTISIPTAAILLFVTDFGRYVLPPLMLLLGLLLWRAWWWPALRYQNIWYRLDEQSLVIRRGVVWRSVVHVPRSRVQHTDVSQGPIERHFELGTLVVHTAGTQHASVALPGLSHTTAVAMRDALIDGGEDYGL